LKTAEARFSISKRLDGIIQKTVDEGIFTTKAEFYKSATIHYLEKLHLLDQLKSTIVSKNQN